MKLWNEAPTEPAFQRQRLTGIVKTRLVQALEAAKVGLATIAEAKDDADLSIEPPLSNNSSALMSDTDRELKDWVRAIERLIAEANQPTLQCVDGAASAEASGPASNPISMPPG